MANCWSLRSKLKQGLATVMLAAGATLSPAAFGDEPAEPDRLRDRFADLAVADELPAGLSRHAFERSLQANYFGTYVFYESLPQPERDGVYETYLRDPHIAAIRTATLERLK